MTDEQLLSQFVGGWTDALGELARRYEGPLLGLARGLLSGSPELACDVVQETWVRVIRFAGQFNGRSGVKTWLYRILINQCHSLRQARPRRSGQALQGSERHVASSLESRAARADMDQLLHRAIDRARLASRHAVPGGLGGLDGRRSDRRTGVVDRSAGAAGRHPGPPAAAAAERGLTRPFP